jgi:hypothetical protein
MVAFLLGLTVLWPIIFGDICPQIGFVVNDHALVFLPDRQEPGHQPW